jgi:predicted DNA-binding ribbon-helix-helix protein
LKEIAHDRSVTVQELVAAIDGDRQHPNLSSAIRLFVLGVYRDQLASSKTNKFGLQSIGT